MNKLIPTIALFLLPVWLTAAEDSASPVVPERVYVFLKPEASTSADQIVLGDVAQVEGYDNSLVDRISGLNLGPSPRPGGGVTLDRDSIRRSMISHSIDPVRVAISGSDEVRVTRSGRKIGQDEMAALVEDYVNRSWQGRDVRTEITIARLPEDVNTAGNDWRLQVLDPIRGPVSGAAAVSLALIEGGQVMQRIPVSIRARVFEKVAVAGRDIHQGDLLQPEDFSIGEYELTDLRSEPVREVAQAAGKRLRRNVRQNQVITLDVLENPPLVERGDEVILIVKFKNVQVNCPGKAWESGGLGDKIMVRNQYGRNMSGQVLDSHTVLITTERMGEQ